MPPRADQPAEPGRGRQKITITWRLRVGGLPGWQKRTSKNVLLHKSKENASENGQNL